MKFLKRAVIGGLFLLLFALPAAADPGTISRAATLRQAPYLNAAPAAALAANTAVEVLERSGGWYRLKTADGKTGWTRMSNVRLAESKQSSSFGKLAGLYESGRSASTKAEATTGIRGLDEKDLARAQPNFVALDALSRYASSPADAAHFAQELKLQSAALPLETEKQR